MGRYLNNSDISKKDLKIIAIQILEGQSDGEIYTETKDHLQKTVTWELKIECWVKE
jgi:hypothetical protein